MPGYRLSGEADADLQKIVIRSIETWGLDAAEAYLLSFSAAFERLATFPEMGRDVGFIRSGYRMIEVGSHLVFFRQAGDGVLIVRVLHRRMDVTRHL